MQDHIITKNRVFVFLCFLIALSLLISFSRNLQANKQQDQTGDKKNYLPLVLKPGTLVPGNLPTSTGTHTATPGPSPTITGSATSTLTPQSENCPTHFEGHAVAGNTHVLVTGVVGTDVSIILANTGETLATTTLIAAPGHDCEGFADFIEPIHPALSMTLEKGWLLLAVNDNGSFDETFVIGLPLTETSTPTPSSTPTAPPTHTPSEPYITLLPNCANSSRITFTIQGFNWPPDENISLRWDNSPIGDVYASQHNGTFSRTFTFENVTDGDHVAKVFADGGDFATATFVKPCIGHTPVPGTATPTSTPVPADLVMVSAPKLVSDRPINAFAPVNFSVIITNAGEIDVIDQFFVDLYFDPTDVYSTYIPIEQSVGYLAVSGLAGGASRVITITAPLGFKNEPNPHTVYAMVDSLVDNDAGDIQESQENNNISNPVIIFDVIPETTPTPTNTPTPSSTPTPEYTATSTATTLPPLLNLCLSAGVSATQSSTNSGGVASRACDGNTDGVFENFSVSRTNSETNPYWEVSLGQARILQQIKIYNRTDSDMEDLSNFYVFTTNSIAGFASTDLITTRNDPNVREYFFNGGVDKLAFALNNVAATHIRIQLAGSGNLNLAEVEIIGGDYIANKCDSLADVFYILDASGSMAGSYPGSTSKIQAAKDAVTTVNNEILASGSDSRVGFVTFTANGTYYDNRTRLNIDLDTINLTENIASVNAEVNNWQAGGGTPTGAAINEARLSMFDTWDPLRTPVIILVSDGVPTVDQDGLYYYDPYVQDINIYKNDGSTFPPNEVANFGPDTSGWGWAYADKNTGNIVAEVMLEIDEMTRSLPDATVHSVALNSSYFNTEVLQYIADVGGGQYLQAGDADSLTEQIRAIYNSISCTPP